MDRQTDLPVIVVGAGLTGLTTAALLARAGRTVTVFEKAGAPGGRARTSERDTFFFNQGAHAFYLGGAGERVLRELDVRYSGSPPDLRTYRALDQGQVHLLPVGAASLLCTRLLTPVAKAEVARLLAMAQRVRPVDLQDVSLRDWLEQHTRSLQARQFLQAGARLATYTNAPDLLPAGLALARLTARVWYLDGGWQTLVDGLADRARQAGARIVTGARVQAMIRAGEEEYSVRLADGVTYLGSAVVLTTDPASASALVMEGTHETLRRWAAQAIPSCVACLDVALRRLPTGRPLALLGVDRPLYLAVHSAAARLAPQGGALVQSMKYLRPGEVADPQAVRQELEAQLDLLHPGWRAVVARQFFLPHMVAASAIVQARFGGLPGRPGPTVPGLSALYVAGDWVGPQGILADACFASARSTAGLILAHAARPRSVLAG